MKVKAVAQISVPIIYEVDIDEENLKKLKKETSMMLLYNRRIQAQNELLEPIWKINRTKSRDEVLKFLNEHLDEFTDDEYSYLLYPSYVEAYPEGVDYRNDDNAIFIYDD